MPEVRSLEFLAFRVRVIIDDYGRFWWETSDLTTIFGSKYMGKIVPQFETDHFETGLTVHSSYGSEVGTSGVSTVAVSYLAVNRKKVLGNQFAAWISFEALPKLIQPIDDSQREKWDEFPRATPRHYGTSRQKPRPRGGRHKSQETIDAEQAKQDRREERKELAKAKAEAKEAPARLLRQFVTEQCTLYPGRSIPKAEFHEAWMAWQKENGRHQVDSAIVFGRLLHAMFPRIKNYHKRNGAKRISCYEGISLKDAEPEPADIPDEVWSLFDETAAM